MGLWEKLKERVEFEGGWFSFLIGGAVWYGVLAFWLVMAWLLLTVIF